MPVTSSPLWRPIACLPLLSGLLSRLTPSCLELAQQSALSVQKHKLLRADYLVFFENQRDAFELWRLIKNQPNCLGSRFRGTPTLPMFDR
jgi:hypothetical protein